MPMISETVSYRDSCRRSGCRKIPLKETQWLIAAAMLGARLTMWFCLACGGQYTHALKDAGEDRGQDLRFNYVIFMQIELGDGIQTMCAFAAAPNDHTNNLLITLKLVLGHNKHKIHPGTKAGLIDLMTVSNNMFVEAMKEFPKISQPTAEPCHVGLGKELTIISDGITSLTANDVGKNQTFLDINDARKNGMFGEEPIPVWRDKEWATLIEMVVSGIELAHTDWEKVRYCPDTWSDADAPARPTCTRTIWLSSRSWPRTQTCTMPT